MSKFKKIEDLYSKLDEAIDNYTNEYITPDKFNDIIKELNDNEFGVTIDPSLVKDNRESFNELGHVSYSSYDEDGNEY